MNALLDQAQKWVDLGISVIPIKCQSKLPDARRLPGFVERKAKWEGYQDRLPTREEIKFWFDHPSTIWRGNLGVVTGWRGLVVIDFDQFDLFADWWGRYPIETFMIGTNRGVHVYLFADQPTQAKKLTGVDIKAAGGYVLAPPSIHPSGKAYEVLGDWPILRISGIEELLPDDLFPEAACEAKSTCNWVIPQAENKITIDPFQIASQPPSISLIADIRNRVKILDFFPDAKKKDPSGRWWVTRCPFHDDHNPSFWIDAARGICGCYAGCTSRPLDVLNLTARLQNITNDQAITLLRGRL